METSQTPGGVRMDIDLSAPTHLDPAPAAAAPAAGQTPAAGAAPAAVPAGKSFLDSVPAEYTGKEWVANFAKTENPLAEMFKSYDNQLSTIGRKNEGLKVPTAESKPEERAEFHRAIGVPESADKYEYTPPTVSDAVKPYYQSDDNFTKTMKQAAHEAGVPAESFKKMAEVFDKFHVTQLEQLVNNTNKILSDADNSFKAKHGDKSGQVLESWQKSFGGMPADQTALVDQLDPRVKVILAEQYHNFAMKYIREDSLGLDKMVSNSGQMTKEQYGDEYAKLFSTIRSSQPGSPAHIEATANMATLKQKGSLIFK